jgi:hypothetical protein
MELCMPLVVAGEVTWLPVVATYSLQGILTDLVAQAY